MNGGVSLILVQQRHPGDCGVACLAMACGESYEAIEANLSKHFDIEIPVNGMTDGEVGRFAKWLGFDVDHTEFLLLGAPQIMAVKSLNYDGKTHFIYFNGISIYDPQEGTGKKFYGRNDTHLLKDAFIFGTIIQNINRRDYGEEYDDRVSSRAGEASTDHSPN